MLADKYKRIKEGIVDIVNSNRCMVDVYTSGSVGRGEERKKGNEVKSDVDIIVIYDKENSENDIKNIFERYKLSQKCNVEISFVYCYVENFINSALTDFVLSIDLSEVIVKKLSYKYKSVKNDILSDNRWVYQFQSCVFYFCKYIIDGAALNLSKTYLNIIKFKIYKEKLVKTNKYILNKEISIYTNEEFIDKNLYEANLLYLSNSQDYSKRTYEKTLVRIYEEFIDVFYDEYNIDKFNILMSLAHFNRLIKEYEIFNIPKEKCYEVLHKVIYENTGGKDFSCIHLE